MMHIGVWSKVILWKDTAIIAIFYNFLITFGKPSSSLYFFQILRYLEPLMVFWSAVLPLI